MHCTHCGTTLGADDRFCPRCGAATAAPTPGTCPTCRATVPTGADVRSGAPPPLLPAGAPPPPLAAPNGGSGWGKVALGGLGACWSASCWAAVGAGAASSVAGAGATGRIATMAGATATAAGPMTAGSSGGPPGAVPARQGAEEGR